MIAAFGRVVFHALATRAVMLPKRSPHPRSLAANRAKCGRSVRSVLRRCVWGAPWPSEKVRHLLSLYKLALGVDGTQGNKDDSVDQSYFFRTARPLTNFPKPTGKGLTKNVGWLLLHPTSDRKARS